MRVGYARVSTTDQDLRLQVSALEDANCDKIFTDTVSGRSKERPGLIEALQSMSEGDQLFIWKLDRLGRSVKHLIEISDSLKKRGIHLHSITDKIDTQDHMGRFYFYLMAALAEMERELIVERTKAGLHAARLAGRIGGRRTVMNEEKKSAAQVLLSNGKSYIETARTLGVSVQTLYRHFPVS